MNKLALAGVIGVAFIMSGCSLAQKFLPKTTAFVCNNEQEAHDYYVRYIGPRRTAAQRAKEQATYEKIMRECAAGAPLSTIDASAAAAAAARN